MEQSLSLLLESNRLLTDSGIEDGDSFAVEVKVEGQWIMPETFTAADNISASQETQPADDASKPLFQSGSDFFSKLQANRPPVAQPLKPALTTKDPRPVPKPSILPGTLGLGNMYVTPTIFPVFFSLYA